MPLPTAVSRRSFFSAAILVASITVMGSVADCATQEPVDLPAAKPFIELESGVFNAQWSQDGTRIVTCTHRKQKDKDDNTYLKFKTVEIWDAVSGKRLGSLGELEIPDYPRHVLSTNGKRLVISQQSFSVFAKELEVWDASRPYLERRIEVEPNRVRPVNNIAVSADGNLIAELFYNVNRDAPKDERSGGINVHDATTGKKVRTLREPTCFPQTAVFTADGKGLITRGSNDIIKLWDLKTGKVLRQKQASLTSMDIALSPDGKTLVIATAKHEPVQVWSVPELKALDSIPHPFYEVHHLQFSPGNKRLILQGWSGPFQNLKAISDLNPGVIVWDLKSRKALHHWNRVHTCGFCGEDHVGVLRANAICRHPIVAKPSK